MEKSRFFNSDGGDRKYLAEDFAAYFNNVLSNGVFLHDATALQVSAYNGLTVRIAAGKAFINGYCYENTANLDKVLETVTSSRIDRIALRLDMPARIISIVIKKGEAAASPVAPALIRTADIYELGIADITLMAGTTAVTAAMITDLRPNKIYCGGVSMTVDRDEFLGDISNTFADFTEAGIRENINTNETTKSVFSKIKKWFADLKALSFKDKVETTDIVASAITEEKIASGAITDAKIANGAAINQNKISGLVDALDSKLESSGNFPDLTAGQATNAINDQNGINIKENYAKKIELVQKVVGNGSIKIGLNNGNITIGTAPNGKTTSDILGVAFCQGSFHCSTIQGGTQNGSDEFDCIGARFYEGVGAGLNIMFARTNVRVSNGIVYFNCSTLATTAITPTGNKFTNYDDQTVSFQGITVFFK